MDKEYWNKFYREAHRDIENPSTFAKYIQSHLEPGQRLFELGCGNGRDSIFFASLGINVTACDQSEISISDLQKRATGATFSWPNFICSSFNALGEEYIEHFDSVYSRFTLHAVTKEVATQAIEWTHKGLRNGGLFFIEARSVNGSLYGLGEARETDAFIYDGHYRRFLRREKLEEELRGIGFQIVESIEESGLSVYKDDDPVLIRITARKS